MPIPFIAVDDEISAFPKVSDALEEPNGLLMAGGSLSPQRLISAYRQGIFPWYEEGEPILWWSPDPRCIIWPEGVKISRSLQKSMRNSGFKITRNQAFQEVMRHCSTARAKSSGTWITEDMINAYCKLNLYGVAQSTEVWQNDQLIGGLYGISLGRLFVGESMFSYVRDASKTALVHLAQSGDYSLIDCQLETPHLVSMGAQTIARSKYMDLLARHGDLSSVVFLPEHLLPEHSQ